MLNKTYGECFLCREERSPEMRREGFSNSANHHKELERWYRLRNLKRAAQVVIVACVLFLISGYAASMLLTNGGRSPDRTVPPDDGMVIEGFAYTLPGAHPCRLEAASAVVSQKQDRVSLTRPRLTYFSRDGGEVVLTADTGRWDKKSGKVTVEGAVTLDYEDYRFKTERIVYDQETRLAESSSPVQLEGTGIRVSGKGLKVWADREEISIEQDVKARLSDPETSFGK
ncbi:LPS export ABC transporter periplasmic protein LptC [Thermodesulfobacteriota bacterium]